MRYRNILIILVLFVAAQALPAAAPVLRCASSDDGFRDPIYSPDGQTIAFTNAAQDQIYVLEKGKNIPRSVAHGEKIGRRFAFEPGGERIVFRLRAYALPGKPERLLSTSIYLYDPVHRSQNSEGDIFGPYVMNGRIWYRYSLVGPFFDYAGQVSGAGPYWDTQNGTLNVLNAALDTVFTSALNQHLAGYELSPDGAWLAVVESQPERRLLVIRIQDGTTFSISGGFAPGWAGDSQSLICVTDRSTGGTDLSVVKLPSRQTAVVLPGTRFKPETPALNSDGTRALFVSEGAIYEMTLP
jgi:Tol biopolymer transport system component